MQVNLSHPCPKSVVDLLQDLYSLVDGIASGKNAATLALSELPVLVAQYAELQSVVGDAKANPEQVEAAAAVYAEAVVNRLLGRTVCLPTVA